MPASALWWLASQDMEKMMKPADDALGAENISHHFAGQDQTRGVYAKEHRIPAGFILVSHKHLYDHLSILASGRVRMTVNGNHQNLVGPYALTIEAGTEHTLRAVTDAVWFCVHATDVADPALVDETLIVREPV